MQKEVIKQEILDRVKGSTRVKSRISYTLNRHQTTIERYLDAVPHDEQLASKEVLKVISEELNIPESEILTEA